MKLYAILVFLALMFAGYNCAVFTWTGLGNDNNYNNPLNWAPNTGVPGSADNATIAATLVTVSSSVTVNALTITSAVRLVVTNGATLTLTSDFFTFTGMTLQVDTGSSFITQNYITLSGTVNFQNFGTVQLNPLFTAGVTLSNVQNGNPVVFTGVRPIQFLGAGTYNIPTGFMFDTSRQQQFQALTGAATVNFKYTENINSNGWQVANDLTNVVSFTFESGVVVNGALTLRSSATTQPRPTVTFAGTSTINTASTWDAIPVIGTGPGTTVTINGNTLGFTNQPVTFNTPALQGTTALSFSNGNTGNLAATFQRAITISAPTPTFSGQWLLTGSDVTLTQATTFSFNMLINANLKFLRGFTFGQGAVIQNNGAGRFTFTDNATSSVGGALDLLTNPVTLACNPPANTFALLGNSFTFSAGLTINACTVSASSSLIIKGQVATTGGNSTLPNTSTVSFFNTDFTFSATNNPASGLYGITVPGALSVPNGVSWTASNVEVTSPAGNTFTLQDNASLRSQNNGLFSINGNLAIGSSCSIPALVAFGSTTISVSTSAKINWNGNILLRNTILGGTGEVWFFGNLVVTKGLSNITNPNFRFKSGFTAGYLFDGFGSNFGATLTINSNGATSNRVIEGSVTANTGVNVVFDDNLNFNNTATLTGTAAAGGAPPGCITFRTSSTLASITTNSAVTFQNFIFFNNTNPHLQGTGTFTFTNNPTVWLTGALNNPPANGDAPVNFNSPTTISLFVDSTVGSNVLFNAFLSTDDLDNNDNVASRTLTLASSGNQLRTVAGVSTKANVIFAGNVLYTAAGTLNDAGFLQINGNSLVLGASPTWNSPVIFNGGATTISTQNNAAATLTIGDQTPKHGFTLSASLTVNSPATLAFNAVVSVNLNNNANIGGSGTVNALNTFVNAPGASSLSPQTLILNNVTFVGTGPVALSPVDSTLQINTLVTAAVPVNYNGATVTLNGDTAVSPLLSFTANPVTIQGAGTLTIANAGSLNLATNWINNVPVVFNSPLTIATTGVLSGSGAITFNNTLTLTQSITLSQAITFGFDPNFVVAVLNSGFTLTLNGAVDITVKGIVLPTGNIVSTSPNNALQTITGGGVINSAWTWSNTVRFGTLNVTGMRTLNFDLVVKAGETACFVNGVVLNTGTFLADTAAGVKTLLIEPFLENNGNNTLGTDLTVRFSRGSSGTFEFRGTVPVMVNSTVMCEANFQFTQNVIFGWINANTANTITFKTFCFNWFNSAAVVQVWRNTLTVNNDVQVNVFPQIVFGMNNTNPVAVTTSGQGALTFQGSLTIAGKAFNTGAGISVGAISITTLQNATINALTLTGPVNFISTTSPWVEPLVMVRNGLSQTLTLTGPIRLDNPTFTSGTGFAGASRLAVTSGFTADSSFTFNVPVQFYVNTQGQVFTVTLNNFGTVVNLAYSPSLFNPNFLNTNFPLDVMVKSTAFNTKFVTNANTSYALGNVEVMGTTLQLSSTNAQTITTRDITIRANSVFWVDNVNVNGQTVTFTDGAPGSVFQFTVSSLNPPRLNVATAYFRGSAVVSVNNFNWDGTAVTAINATASFQTQNTPFAVTTGTPGFQYQSVRNGQNAQFTRSANPTVSPFPTNSNGPSPAVSSSSVLSVNMLFFVLMSVLVFFF